MILGFYWLWSHWWCTAIVLAAWYGLVLLWCWHERDRDQRTGQWEKRFLYEADDRSTEEEELLGAPMPEYGTELLDSQSIFFKHSRGAVDDRATLADPDEEKLGLLPDVLEELKEAATVVVQEQGSREELLELLRAVAERYPRLRESKQWGHVRSWIGSQMPFALSDTEIEGLWTSKN